MHRTLQIGITGGIGSGKSLITRIFRALGAPIYDADSRAKKLMTTDGILIEQIKKEFGTLSYDGKGTLNREFLAATVFNHPGKLATLNALVHPRVALDYEMWVQTHIHSRYCIKEAALLVESGSYQSLDKLIVVTAPEALRIERVINRDKQRSRNDVKKIIENQMPEAEKIAKADFVIRNDETVLVIPQVLKLHERFSVTN